jgi:hypothetical protein
VHQTVHLSAWGVTPSFTARLGDNWRARQLFNYGESDTEAHAPLVNDTVLNNAIRAGLFNPYNPSASDPAGLAALERWETFGHVRQSQLQTRAIIDGDLVELPGGAAPRQCGPRPELQRPQYRGAGSSSGGSSRFDPPRGRLCSHCTNQRREGLS